MLFLHVRFPVFLLACLLLLCGRSHSEPRFQLQLGPGVAIPCGQLLSKDFDSGGYALLGQDYAMAARFFILPSLGVECAGSIALFPFDAGQYAQDKKEHSDPALESLSIAAGFYLVNTVSAGLVYRYPLNDRWSLTASLLAGWIGAETAPQNIRAVYFMIGEYDSQVTSSFDESAIWQTEAGISRKIFKHWGLSLTTGFNRADMKFKFQTKTEPYTKNLTLSWLNASLGVDFLL